MADDEQDNLLSVTDLRVTFPGPQDAPRPVRAVDGATFDLRRGRTLAIVGESGCGKSVTAYSIMRLIEPPGRIVGGRIVLRPSGRQPIDVTALGERDDALYELRGGLAGMVFQEPMTALSPVHSIGNHMIEALRLHKRMTRPAAEELAAAMLGKVGIPSPARRLRQYPHEMSGGMRQRVMLAMALVCGPELLIADEPTTALDVTIQAHVLGLIARLQRELPCPVSRQGSISVLLITHDLGVVAQTAHDVAVMYLGRIVERGDVRSVLRSPAHPYTRGLLASLPGASLPRKLPPGARHSRLASIPGSVPWAGDVPDGCAFHPRCPHARAGLCDAGPPPPERALPASGPHASGRRAACHRLEELP